MWLILLALGAVGVGYAVSNRRDDGRRAGVHNDGASGDRKAIAYMKAQLSNAGALWGVFERSKLVSAMPVDFEMWDLVRAATKDTAYDILNAAITVAQNESPGAVVEFRLLGIGEDGVVIANTLSTTGGTAVSGDPVDEGRTLAQQIAYETDQEFWRVTGHRPGRRLNYRDPDDAAMIPVWLTIEYAQVMRHLETAKLFGSESEHCRLLLAYKQRLDHRFAADPTIDKRAKAQMKRLADSSF